MEIQKIEMFKSDLKALLRKYDAAISIRIQPALIEYPAIVFNLDGKEYWSVDDGGFAASVIVPSEIDDIVLKR